jgi:hypothetical protein
MTIEELMALRTMTIQRREAVHSFADDARRIWNITPGWGEPWVRVYAGYDLDRRTLPYVSGPGVGGKRRG